MTGRILNPETGAYEPEPPAQIDQQRMPVASAKGLPKQKADPYEHVDVHAFDQAPNLSRSEMLQMAAIAEQRQDAQTALWWKGQVSERVRQEQQRAELDHTMKAFTSQPVPPDGAIIYAPTGNTPWANDPDYQEALRQVAEAEDVSNSSKDPAAVLEANRTLSNAQQIVNDAREAARTKAVEAGQWTVQDDMVAAAKESLRAKAGLVADQARRTASEG